MGWGGVGWGGGGGGGTMKCLAWGPELRGVGASGRLCVIQFWPSNLKHDF